MQISGFDPLEYLIAALEEQDQGVFLEALGRVAMMHGIGQIAKATGISRNRLGTTLSAKGRPTFGTVFKVLDALGMRLTVTVKHPAPKPI